MKLIRNGEANIAVQRGRVWYQAFLSVSDMLPLVSRAIVIIVFFLRG